MNHFEQIAEKLAAWGLDAIMLTAAPNRLYATGFRSSAGLALVTGQSAWFMTDSRYIEAAQRAVEDAEVRLVDAAHSYTALVKDVIEAEGITRLGFEDDRMSVASWEMWRKALPCELVGAGSRMDELRMVKDSEEIEKLLAAQKIAEAAFTELLKEIRPGVTERQLAARLDYLMLTHGAEKPSFDTIVASGANGSKPHAVPSDKPVAAGEFITFDFGAMKDGYCSDTTRTVAVGHVTEEMRRVYDTVLQAQLAGIAAAKAGVPGRDVDGAARDYIKEAGYGDYFGHGFGHGLGIEVHEAPTAALSYDKPLPAGAVISAEPGIYLPGKLGVRIEDVLILTEDGSRNITGLTKELLIL